MIANKKILVTGVRNKRSVAFWIARTIMDQGGEVVLASPEVERTKRTAQRLPETPPVWKLDVTEPETIASIRDQLLDRWNNLDGFVHSIAYADRECINPDFFKADRDQILQGFDISSFSLVTLCKELYPLMKNGGSIVSLSFETKRIWPPYGWMNFFKVALEYFTKMMALRLGEEGIRINSVSAGPMKTLSARGIPGFSKMADKYESLAPLDWDTSEAQRYVADTCAWLLSGNSKMISGEVIHVDGGANVKSGFGLET